jgi:hypothetical protein
MLIALIASTGCPQDGTVELVANLTSNRNTVETYVRQVKLRYQASDPIYIESQTRYASAYSAYAAYIAALRLNIVTGTKQDLTTLTSQSQIATNLFTSYVASNLSSTSRSLLSEPLTFTTIANFLVGKVTQDVRNQKASLISNAVQWKGWSEIS